MTVDSHAVEQTCIVYHCEQPALAPQYGRVRCAIHESASSVARLTAVPEPAADPGPTPDKAETEAVDLEKVRDLVRQLMRELGL